MTSLLVSALLSAAAAMQPAPTVQGFQISGTVVDSVSQRPIPRTLVRLSPLDEQGQLTSLTAENGRFRFSNIPKGKYRLAAQRRGERPQQLNETSQYSTAIVVGPGLDSTNIVFSLHPQCAISGLVIDQDGDPVQTATIALFGEVVLEGEKRILELGGGVTNSQGRFRIAQLAAGTYYVAVQGHVWFAFGGVIGSLDNSSETDVTYPLTYYRDTTEMQAATPIALTEGATAQLQITLHSVPNIHVPLPASRSSLSGSWMPQLFLRGPGGARIPVAPTYSGSGVGGHSIGELSGVAPGTYLLQSPNGREGHGQEVELADGVPLSIPERQKTIAISGQVIFEGGQSNPGGLQILFVGQGEQNRFVVSVGGDGSFRIPDEAAGPGSYSVQAVGGDFVIKSVAGKGVRVIGDRVEFVPNSSASLSMVAVPASVLSKLDGFVLREGQPAGGCMVLLVPADPTRSGLFRRDQSDSDGSFTLPAILPGRYTLLAIDDGGRDLVYKDPVVIKHYLAAGQTLDFPLRSNESPKVTVQPRIP